MDPSVVDFMVGIAAILAAIVGVFAASILAWAIFAATARALGR